MYPEASLIVTHQQREPVCYWWVVSFVDLVCDLLIRGGKCWYWSFWVHFIFECWRLDLHQTERRPGGTTQASHLGCVHTVRWHYSSWGCFSVNITDTTFTSLSGNMWLFKSFRDVLGYLCGWFVFLSCYYLNINVGFCSLVGLTWSILSIFWP